MRWRIQPPLAFVLLLNLAPSGCATAPPASPKVAFGKLRAATLSEVLAAYDGYCRGIETFSASGDLDVRDPRKGRERRLGVRLLAARGGRLYLKGSVAVVTALEFVSDGDRFWFQLPSQKTVWTGPVTAAPPAEEETSAPYSALRPADLTAALLPEPLAPGPEDALVLEGDRESFSLVLARPRDPQAVAARRVWVRRETLEVLRLRTYAPSGDVVLEATYGAWKDGVPHAVSVRRVSEGYEADFTFSKVTRNVAVPERIFVPRTPQGYAVKEVLQ